MKRGDVCRCISDFTGMLSEEISIYKNDIVQVLSVVDRHWLEVEGGGSVGNVPSSVLVNMELPQHPQERPLFVAAADFMPSQEGDLGFARGDFVIGLNPIDDAWWCGEVFGKKGIFPLNFVWKINKDIMEVVDRSEKPVCMKGRVKMSLRAQLPEELDLYAGDIVNITYIVDKDWYRGESNGATGIFPSGFVEILESTSVPSLSTSVQESNLSQNYPSHVNLDSTYIPRDKDENRAPPVHFTPQAGHTVSQHVESSLNSSKSQGPICDPPAMLSRTSAHWKTIDAEVDMDILDDDYFKQNMPGLFSQSTINSSNEVPPNIPPLSQASASDSFSHIKPRCENIMDSLTSNNSVQSEFSHPESHTHDSSNTRPLQTGNLKHRYENVADNDTSIRTSVNRYENVLSSDAHRSDILQSALTADAEESSSDCVLNSLSQKIENYFASNISDANESNGNILNNNNNLIKQYSSVSSPGYNEDNTGIEPYGRAIFSFKAQYPNELTFKKGDIIHLIKHVDSHWTQGRVGNAKGIFPTSYVDIIVNCLHNEEELFLARCESLVNTSYLGHAKAEYSFEGEQSGDVTMNKGDILKVIKYVDDNWVIVETMNGLKGMCPKNYISILTNLIHEHEDASQREIPVSEDSCNRASRQVVQSSSTSRSRSTSPYDTSGSRRSYKKDDFGTIKKQEVETVLAKNIASLDVACKSSHPEKREKESIFIEREIDEQAEPSKITVEEVAKADCLPAIPPRQSKMLSPAASDVAAAKPSVAPRTLILPPVPPRVKVGIVDSVQPMTLPDRKDVHSISTSKSTEVSPAPKGVCSPVQELSSLDQTISSGAIYSKVQKPHLVGKPSKSKLQLRMSKKGSIADGTPLVRGDSANSASFPDDVSRESIGSEGTYSSEALNGSTSPAILPQRPAPPPPPKTFGSGYEDAEEFYSLPPEDNNGDRKVEQPVLQEGSDKSQPVVETCVAVDPSSSSLRNESHDEASCSQENDIKASAKVDIRRELMQEIVTTEHEYIHDLEALVQVIRLAPTQKEAQAVDLDTLMGNLTQVISVAKKLLSHLDSVAYESNENLKIGRVFLLCASELCEVYKLYCSNHNVAAEPLLRKYTEEPTAAAFLQWVLSELQQHKIQLMDMRSVLIKPVQRVLKYPLFLDRLVSETPSSHPDYEDLVEAKSRMANVAKEINEYTKRLDLINKYRSAVDQSLQSKMQRVSMHSVAKKSARFSAIVSEKLGIMTTTKDPDFDEEEAKFRCVQRATLSLVQDVKDLSKSINARHRAELEISKAVSAILIEGARSKEMEAIQCVTLDACNRLLQMFESFVNRRIAIPASHLVSLCEVPERLIGKRYDKLLDFDNAQYRLDRNKDPTRTRILEEELSHAKGTYEALNTQLMMELPILTNAGTEMLSLAIRSLVAARMYLQGHLAKLYLQLAQVPALSYSGEEEMLTQFRVKYLHQVGEFRQLSFIPAETLQRSLPRARVRGKKSLDNTAAKTTTEATKQKVLSKYPADVIYVVNEVHTPGEVMELTLYPGDHVALLKNKDPLGRTDRWFIDDGDNKGFARAACLRPLQPCDGRAGAAVTSLPSSVSSAEPLPSANPSAAPRPSTLPRAAPAPPFPERPPRYEDIFPAGATATSRHQNIGGYTSDNRVAPPPRYSVGQEFHVLPNQTPLPSKPGHVSSAQSTVLESDYYSPPLDRRQSNDYNSPVSEESNIYEEIDQGGAEYIDKNGMDIADSSPIYEAIEDSNLAETGDNPLPESELEEPEFYYALYNFGGSDCTQLNLTAGQVVLLIQAKSPDWWFVEDRHGNHGYVPASYLTKYT